MELSFAVAIVLVVAAWWVGLATGIWVGRWLKVGILLDTLPREGEP